MGVMVVAMGILVVVSTVSIGGVKRSKVRRVVGARLHQSVDVMQGDGRGLDGGWGEVRRIRSIEEKVAIDGAMVGRYARKAGKWVWRVDGGWSGSVRAVVGELTTVLDSFRWVGWKRRGIWVNGGRLEKVGGGLLEVRQE